MKTQALLMLLAKLAARGASKVPKSATKHRSQQYLEKSVPTRREGVGAPQSPRAPIQQTTSPYTDRTRQSAYNKRGKLGRALMDAGRRADTRLGKGLYQPPKPIGPEPEVAGVDLVKQILKRVGGRAGKVEGLRAVDKWKDLIDPDRQLSRQEELEEHLASLTPEELEEFAAEAKKQPSLFDALTSPVGLGGGR